jgi:hypothetical protein
MDLAGLLHISIFMRGCMVLKVCRSNCKINLAKGTYYNTKNQCGPRISDCHYNKIFDPETITKKIYEENQ